MCGFEACGALKPKALSLWRSQPVVGSSARFSCKQQFPRLRRAQSLELQSLWCSPFPQVVNLA